MTVEEENALADVIRSARTVQTFLWGRADGEWGIEEWRRMFRKRVAKIDAIQRDNPHAAIEFKKRLLQQAALSVALIAIIEREGITWDHPGSLPSNLQEFEHMIEEVSNG